MTPIIVPAAVAAAATTPKACPNGHEPGDCLPEAVAQRGMQVSWLVLPAGTVVAPGDRIAIQAVCPGCRGGEILGVLWNTPHRKCGGSGVVTYGEATVAEVVPVFADISDQFPFGPPQPGDAAIRIENVEATK